MRKHLVLMVSIVLTLTITFSVSAIPKDELTDLANFVPADAIAFGTFRMDDGYAQDLEAFVQRLNENLDDAIGPVMIPDMATVVDGLFYGSDGEFYEFAYDWFGPTYGFGVISVAGETIGYQVFRVTDRDSYLADVDRDGGNFEETDDYTITDSFWFRGVLTNDDVAIITGNIEHALLVLDALENGDTLAESPVFNETIEALPADEYNIIGYLNLPVLIETIGDNLAADGMELFTALNVGNPAGLVTFGFGLTLIDERNLVLDLASVPLDPAAYLAQPDFVLEQPVNPAFAANLSAETQLLIHDYGLGTDFQALVDGFNVLGPQMQTLLDLQFNEGNLFGSDLEARLLRNLDLATINVGGVLENFFLTPLFAGVTGLNFEDEVAGWMTDDYAVTAGLGTMSDGGPALDFGFLAANTDAEAADYVVQRLTQAAQAYNFDVTETETGVSIGESIMVEDMSFALQLATGTSESVFALGSQSIVDFALTPDAGASLADNAVFGAAADLLVADPYTVWYVNGQAIAGAIPLLDDFVPSRDLLELQYVIAQVESMTISANMDAETGVVQGRFTLTIPENVPYISPFDDGGF
jgi:hypothetical protein